MHMQFLDPATLPSYPDVLTVFAPTDQAFEHLAPGVVDTLQRPENRDGLLRILAYHIVPGRMNAPRLRAAIRAGRGTARLQTVGGGVLTARLYNPECIELQDEQGGIASVSAVDIEGVDLYGKVGITHVVDRVLMPTV